jgi:hypothetical protein
MLQLHVSGKVNRAMVLLWLSRDYYCSWLTSILCDSNESWEWKLRKMWCQIVWSFCLDVVWTPLDPPSQSLNQQLQVPNSGPISLKYFDTSILCGCHLWKVVASISGSTPSIQPYSRPCSNFSSAIRDKNPSTSCTLRLGYSHLPLVVLSNHNYLNPVHS